MSSAPFRQSRWIGLTFNWHALASVAGTGSECLETGIEHGADDPAVVFGVVQFLQVARTTLQAHGLALKMQTVATGDDDSRVYSLAPDTNGCRLIKRRSMKLVV